MLRVLPMPELLPAGEIHVWLLRRPSLVEPSLLARVTAGEQQRAQAMHSVRRQCEWLAGRALMRQCLAHYTGLDPLALVLDKTESGKPLLALPDAPAFNLSHGPGWLGCAVARAERLGLDIDSESRRNRTGEIAARYFHPQEQLLVRAGGNAAFFRSWTLKEAYIKALGETINSVRLHELGFAADGQPLFALPAAGWYFRHEVFDAGHHLALACQWRQCDTVGHLPPRCRVWFCEPDLQQRQERTGSPC